MKSRDIAIGVGLLLLLSPKKAVASTALAPQPSGSKSFAVAWRERAAQLVKRSKSGAVWASRLAKRLGSPEAGAAAAR